jgi:hypothetical protein
MDTLTTTIKREFLRDIVAGRKKVEYRELKPYWDNRLSKVRPPFLLRLINGMSAQAPEVMVSVRRVSRNTRARQYELHLGVRLCKFATGIDVVNSRSLNKVGPVACTQSARGRLALFVRAHRRVEL